MEREDQLYAPVKALLEAQGYAVKGEVGAADVVAVRGDEPPVIVELKLKFSLSLFHQAIARLAITDHVYIAVPRPGGRQARRMMKDNLAMCRRLGLGLITVLADGRAEVHCDPGPYTPRKYVAGAPCANPAAPRRSRTRLLREFQTTGCAATGIPTRAAPLGGEGTASSPPTARTRWPDCPSAQGERAMAQALTGFRRAPAGLFRKGDRR